LVRPSGALASTIVRKEDEPSAQGWEILRKRVVQHNLRVVAAAYSRCRFARLAALLGLDAPTTEAMVSELVSGGDIYAKMDRPAGVVVFEKPRPATAVLTDWARDLDEVLSLIDKTTHIISKEVLVAAAKAGAARA
jgi:26S proteasome regulatory subunit N5